jgi:hypothetical protein
MASIVLDILASADDGYTNDLPQFLPSSTAFTVGDTSGYTSEGWLRFDSAGIPIGAEIDSAHVQFTAKGNTTANTVNLNIYFEDADDPDEPSDRSDFLGRSKTSAVAWNAVGGWSSGVTYDSPELKTILQEVIDRPGWASGQAIQVIIMDNGSSGSAYRSAQSYDQSPALACELHVTYTEISVVQDEFTIDDSVDADDGSEYIDDSFTITDDVIVGFEVSDSANDEFTIDDIVQAGYETEHSVGDDLTIDDQVDAAHTIENADISDNLVVDDSTDCFLWSEWLRENLGKYQIRYFATLTGDADGESDQLLKHTSFQSTKRNGDPTYLSVIIPGFEYSSAINARSNGDLRIEMAYLINGVESFRENIIEVDLDNIRMDEGPRRRSITLSGNRTVDYGENLVTLENPIYKYVSDGKIRYRFLHADPWLNPGDVVRCRNDEFVAQYITYTISDRFKQMEVSEV